MYCKTNADLHTFSKNRTTMKVDVFTDGACSRNGQVGSKASWACWFPEYSDISKAERVPEHEQQTNQRGELMAISKAAEIAEKRFSECLTEIELHIYSDSVYSKNCLTTWLPAWLRNDWKNSQGNPVAHRDLIESTANCLAKFKSYTITYVKAHTGGNDYQSKNNHIVDRMAVEVIDPIEKVKEVTSNKEDPFSTCPLKLMGPPVSEKEIVRWCLENLDKLDESTFHTALISAFSKTVKAKGFEVVKQRLHRTVLYRLKTDNGLIKEDVVVTKEE